MANNFWTQRTSPSGQVYNIYTADSPAYGTLVIVDRTHKGIFGFKTRELLYQKKFFNISEAISVAEQITERFPNDPIFNYNENTPTNNS